MFERQWFAPGYQPGLHSSSIEFEEHLREKDYESAFRILRHESELPTAYRKRLCHRLNKIQELNRIGRYDHIKPVKVFMSGFWHTMDPFNCQVLDFIRAAAPELNIEATLDPSGADIEITSCYGNRLYVRNERALQILFLGENVRPVYRDFDFSITSDLSNYLGRNCYLPLWMLELDWFNKSNYSDRKPLHVETITKGFTVRPQEKLKKVVFIGNNAEPWRTSVLSAIRSKGIPLDVFGSHTKPIGDKLSLTNKYILTVSFENGYSPGYVTEKLVHAYQAKTNLLYYGCLDGTLFRNSHYPIVCLQENSTFDIVTRVASIVNSPETIRYAPLAEKKSVIQFFTDIQKDLRSFLLQFIA